jgi:drug/metabolite transporter (DMT)-like permease
MLLLGSLLALFSGTLMALASALEKREGMRTALARKGFALLAALARRPVWVAGILASALGWVFEAAALTLSPVTVVATLRNSGRAVLVPFGWRWLDERFSRVELAGVLLTIVGGTITVLGSTGASIVRHPLSNITLLEVAAGCAVVTAAVASLSRRLAGDLLPGTSLSPLERRRSQAAGIAAGAAVGVLFAGTGVYTKEIGDRVAIHGFSGLLGAFASANPYLMVASTIWAQSLLQQAFRRANAASVASANATVASTGLIAAGFALYGQHISGELGALALFGGIAIATLGTVMLAASRPAVRQTTAALSAELDNAVRDLRAWPAAQVAQGKDHAATRRRGRGVPEKDGAADRRSRERKPGTDKTKKAGSAPPR